MNTKKTFWLCALIISGAMIYLTACHKKDSNDVPAPITVTDIDGNVYKTVTIGSQVWMAENLKVTHYRNGTLIPEENDAAAWGSLTTGASCIYGNDNTNLTTYGRLYNWYAVNDLRNIAPVGWHVPSDAEFTILINKFGGLNLAGGKLKETGTTHWSAPNTGATNESGFTALPGGYRIYDGSYIQGGADCSFWSSIESDLASAEFWFMTASETRLYHDPYNKKTGMSLRCIRD